MLRFLVPAILLLLAQPVRADAPAPPAPSPRVAGVVESLKPDRNRSAALQSLAISIGRDESLRNDPAVFAAAAACADDPNPGVRAEAARTIGSLWVWGRKPQKPEAIELERKLAHDKDPSVVHNAVYFGLSTADEKTDDVINAMLDASAAARAYDEINLHGRIAWGLKQTPPDRLAPLFERVWSRADADPNAAWLVYRLYVQTTGKEPPRPERFVAVKAKVDATEAARKAELKKLMPGLAKELAEGDSKARMAAMQRIYATPDLLRNLDESVIDAFAAAAQDADPRVRGEVARLTGNAWVWGVKEQHPRVIDLALELAKDADWNVRHYAVYFTLSTATNKTDDVIRAMLENAIIRADMGTVDRVAWGLKGEKPERLAPFFEPYFAKANDEPAVAGRALTLYRQIVGRDPPGVERFAGLDVAAKNYEQTFRQLYDYLGANYPNFAMKSIDWKKVGDELLPRAKGVKDDEAFGLLCMELVARLQDSHAQLIAAAAKPPAVRMPEWDAGFACLIDDRGRPVVFDVVHGSPADQAGVKPGTAVVSVNGKPAEELLAETMTRLGRYWGYSSDRALRYDAARLFARQEQRGAPVKLVLEDPDGNRREALAAAKAAGSRYIPRRPVPVEGSDDSADVSWARLGDSVGYLYVRRIKGDLPESLDKALSDLGNVRSLVIDVRGNSGGGFDAKRAVRNFAQGDPEEPQRPRFEGPIAMLIDERCVSAGEGWASWFVANKRAKLFGSASAGASSRKATYPLTNGLYSVVVPVKAYTGFLDRPIERRGLEPDVAVRCNSKDLAAGKDTVLEAAKRYLTQAAVK
jgi:carboxyl-terminal processing protease